ncbi:MAG: hypothetical protein U5L74_15460 [Ideonella sp.]|nr:hypothetical protein [Ideonella sp.]
MTRSTDGDDAAIHRLSTVARSRGLIGNGTRAQALTRKFGELCCYRRRNTAQLMTQLLNSA